MAWVWLPAAVVLGAHTRSLAVYGGAPGVRDEGLLMSALARPENLAAYGAPSVFELSAAYGWGLVRNHPFIDGNKRTAFLASAVFLELNGWRLVAPEEEATAVIFALAAGEVGEAAFAQWIEAFSIRIEGQDG